ncbi:MAG: benzoyl-CoA-dihydrodiol lyase [Hyphomicrobiaceae bacterium]|nr:benzoyl-CoA-dihydrodiol lyase [Hyphomicrobiaceae bacterium]
MADAAPNSSAAPTKRIDFQTEPSRYHHWKIVDHGTTAELIMDVDENATLFDGYNLKLNSYDLGVDIELADAIQRLRFEHPKVKVVVFKSGKEKVFCAGANIRMLASATHPHKVNFCKFTNETRCGMEDSSENSGQKYLCAVKGTAAGGGYELAVSCDKILLADDGNSSVSLPELPLLAVLPGTGGITRVTDKRKVRRDLTDVFCTTEEGVKGKRAVQWRLVDRVAPASKFDAAEAEMVAELAATVPAKQGQLDGVKLTALKRTIAADTITYSTVKVDIDRPGRRATITLTGPTEAPPASAEAMYAQGVDFWPLRLSRELDDAILELRLNELEIGTIVFRSEGDAGQVLAYDAFLRGADFHWFAKEITNQWKRVLKRVDMTSRSLVALVEPGSCFSGTLAEIVFACDRSFMFAGKRKGDNHGPAAILLSEQNFGTYPMSNGITRLQTRFLGEPESVGAAEKSIGKSLDATDCEDMGLVTIAFDEIDWDDEIRIFLEERTSFSPDGLTGMEANTRFSGPETMETKIFGRLTAWQNWIFQRPNAVGENGALRRYGTGIKGDYDLRRV